MTCIIILSVRLSLSLFLFLFPVTLSFWSISSSVYRLIDCRSLCSRNLSHSWYSISVIANIPVMMLSLRSSKASICIAQIFRLLRDDINYSMNVDQRYRTTVWLDTRYCLQSSYHDKHIRYVCVYFPPRSILCELDDFLKVFFSEKFSANNGFETEYEKFE